MRPLFTALAIACLAGAAAADDPRVTLLAPCGHRLDYLADGAV